MKKILPVLVAAGLLMYINKLDAQSSPNTLDVVGWNLEWFGAAFDGPNNEDLQRENAKRIIRYLDADIYGLVEIVDTAQTRRLVDSLGKTEYGYFISPFCSSNTTGTGGSWTSGQKLAFIYRKSIFSNVTTRGLMRTSSNAYTNWASGRFPFMLSATVTINGISKNMNFIVIHGKAGSTASDYQRRLAGAQELKDTLDAQFSATNNFILGDFNDALNTSIYTGAGGVSSYTYIVADSTDADHYKSITLPLGNAGQTSMTDFPNVIDNHIISNELEQYYVPGSAKIRTDVTTIIPDYITAHNTSDHYPVFSQYNLAGVFTSVPNISATELGIITFPNPFKGEINIKATKSLTQVQLKIINMQGQVLSEQQFTRIAEGTIVQPYLPSLSTGVYFLQIQTKEYRTTVKLVHL
jgi:Secretion system C-terminal sorting domain